ncbi:hypothetical protein Trydic_g5277 [Trypoxylus dichotomus]
MLITNLLMCVIRSHLVFRAIAVAPEEEFTAYNVGIVLRKLFPQHPVILYQYTCDIRTYLQLKTRQSREQRNSIPKQLMTSRTKILQSAYLWYNVYFAVNYLYKRFDRTLNARENIEKARAAKRRRGSAGKKRQTSENVPGIMFRCQLHSRFNDAYFVSHQ